MTKRIILAFAAALASLTLFAQGPSGGVKGTVINRNGRQPVENARLILMQGATEIALTKLDVLSYLDEIPVCVRYELNGELTDKFPFPAALDECKPVIETVKGWKQDISGVRSWAELPEEAKAYVQLIERAIGCPIKWVSVGPERESIILRG